MIKIIIALFFVSTASAYAAKSLHKERLKALKTSKENFALFTDQIIFGHFDKPFLIKSLRELQQSYKQLKEVAQSYRKITPDRSQQAELRFFEHEIEHAILKISRSVARI